MLAKSLLRLQHERRDIGFLGARVTEEESSRNPSWALRIESPANAEEFRDHLTDGSSMSLVMVTRDGERLSGEAYVATISDGMDTATVVVLTGAGPLRHT